MLKELLAPAFALTLSPGCGGGGSSSSAELASTMPLPVATTQVTRWQGDAPAAVSMTFDDADESHWVLGARMLRDRGLLGSFYLPTDWVTDWQPWRDLASEGHEIGSHTVTHPLLTGLPLEQVEQELLESKNILEAEIGQEVLTFAYPFSAENDAIRAVASNHYVASRAGPLLDTVNPSAPPDWHGLHAIVPISSWNLARMQVELDRVMAEKGWLIVQIHGIGNSTAWQPVPASVYRGFLDDALTKDVWITRMIDVISYVVERDSVRLTTRLEDPNTLRVQIRIDELPKHPVPLTLQTVLPEGWTDATISGATTEGPSKVFVTNNERRIQYDVGAQDRTVRIRRK